MISQPEIIKSFLNIILYVGIKLCFYVVYLTDGTNNLCKKFVKYFSLKTLLLYKVFINNVNW